ncbi:hypothetical protein XENTR_v10020043 [Xenopus tropicalis]|nr:hypothetical protein XENTR_v10020043 [Xenopus tropicalis]
MAAAGNKRVITGRGPTDPHDTVPRRPVPWASPYGKPSPAHRAAWNMETGPRARPPVPSCAPGASDPALPMRPTDDRRGKTTSTNPRPDPKCVRFCKAKRDVGSRTAAEPAQPKVPREHRLLGPLIPVRVEKARLKIMDPERVRSLRCAGLAAPGTGEGPDIPRMKTNRQSTPNPKQLDPLKRSTKQSGSAPVLSRRKTAPVISHKRETEKKDPDHPKEDKERLLLAQQVEHMGRREENSTLQVQRHRSAMTDPAEPKRNAEERCSTDPGRSWLENTTSRSSLLRMEETRDNSHHCYVQTKVSRRYTTDCSPLRQDKRLQSVGRRQVQLSEDVQGRKTVDHTQVEVSGQANRHGSVDCSQVQCSEQAEGQGTVDCTKVEHSDQAEGQGTVDCTEVEHSDQTEGQGSVDCTQVQRSDQTEGQGTVDCAQVQRSFQAEGQGTVDCTQVQRSDPAEGQGTVDCAQVQRSDQAEGQGTVEGNPIHLLGQAEGQEVVDHTVNPSFRSGQPKTKLALKLSSDSSDSGLGSGSSSLEGLIETPKGPSVCSAENRPIKDNIIRRSQGILVLTNSTDEDAIFIPKLEFAFTPDSSVDCSVLPQAKWGQTKCRESRGTYKGIYTPRGPSLSKSVMGKSLLIGGRSENYPSGTNNRHLATTDIVDLSLSFRDKFLKEIAPSDIPKILLTDEENDDV